MTTTHKFPPPQCLPDDEDECGDGRHARYAQLIYPKGLAVSAEGIVYWADGTTIRQMDERGTVSTLISRHTQQHSATHSKPIPCDGTVSLKDVNLKWPVNLAVNPLDNSVYFTDDNIVMEITENRHLKVVAGRPLHCSRPLGHSSFYNNFAAYTTLASPQAIAFSPASGELYIAESDARRINRVSVVGTDGRIRVFAGKDSKCNCQEASCDCFAATGNNNNNNQLLAIHSLFRFISGLAVTPDGAVHVADQTNFRIRTIRQQIPEMDPAGVFYAVHSPENQGWKFMSCISHCQELCQQASLLLIGWTRVNNQSEACRSVS